MSKSTQLPTKSHVGLEDNTLLSLPPLFFLLLLLWKQEYAGSEEQTLANNGGHEIGGQSKPGENGESHFASYSVLKQPIWTVPPKGSKMPPLEAFALTKEMIDFRAKKKVIAVTFANFAFMDFVLNWVRHFTEYEVTNLLVGMVFFTLTLIHFQLDLIFNFVV